MAAEEQAMKEAEKEEEEASESASEEREGWIGQFRERREEEKHRRQEIEEEIQQAAAEAYEETGDYREFYRIGQSPLELVADEEEREEILDKYHFNSPRRFPAAVGSLLSVPGFYMGAIGAIQGEPNTAAAGAGLLGVGALGNTYWRHMEEQVSDVESAEERLSAFRRLNDTSPEQVKKLIGHSDREEHKVREAWFDSSVYMDPDTTTEQESRSMILNDADKAADEYESVIEDGQVEQFLWVDEETGEYELWVAVDWYDEDLLDPTPAERSTYGVPQLVCFKGYNEEAVELYQNGEPLDTVVDEIKGYISGEDSEYIPEDSEE